MGFNFIFFEWFFKIGKQAKTDIDGRVVYNFSEPEYVKNSILLPKLFWPTSYCEKKLFQWSRKTLRLLEQFIQTVKGQNNIW